MHYCTPFWPIIRGEGAYPRGSTYGDKYPLGGTGYTLYWSLFEKLGCPALGWAARLPMRLCEYSYSFLAKTEGVYPCLAISVFLFIIINANANADLEIINDNANSLRNIDRNYATRGGCCRSPLLNAGDADSSRFFLDDTYSTYQCRPTKEMRTPTIECVCFRLQRPRPCTAVSYNNPPRTCCHNCCKLLLYLGYYSN